MRPSVSSNRLNSGSPLKIVFYVLFDQIPFVNPDDAALALFKGQPGDPGIL